MSRILDVYLFENLAGQLIQDASGQLTFRNDDLLKYETMV